MSRAYRRLTLLCVRPCHVGTHFLADARERYFDSERASAIKGIGLGLSITKQAVEAMHGQLGVTDKPGHGCIFSLSFPLLRPSHSVSSSVDD